MSILNHTSPIQTPPTNQIPIDPETTDWIADWKLFRKQATDLIAAAVAASASADSTTYPDYRVPQQSMTKVFYSLLAEWRRDTEFSSNANEILLHPAHLAIVALGKPVLRYIFKDMATGRGDWLTALDAIFLRRSPFKNVDERNARAMREAWLDWARKHGYL